MKSIQIDRDIHTYLLSKAASASEALSLTLRRELHVPEPTETLEVDDETFAFLLSRAVIVGESASDILRRELHLDHTLPSDGPATIVFHIPVGTGTQPWNKVGTTVEGAVGDTLRIMNDDSVPHQLHTSGKPFPHPSSDILPGESADFLLQSVFNGPLHDHKAGPDAQFFIKVHA